MTSIIFVNQTKVQRLTFCRSSSPFFSRLPPELRLKIYRCLLFVGKVAPYSNSEAKALLPYVPVLRVCKAILSEAEPVVYENTFILLYDTAVQKLFDRTLATPARKLKLKSVEMSLEYKCPSLYCRQNISMRELSERFIRTGTPDSEMRCPLRSKERETWPAKIDLVLEKLTLDRIVLDMSQSTCSGSCECKMAAISIMYFNKGFALQAPKSVEIKGWDAGGEEAEAMVHDCLRVWTSKRTMGDPGSARNTKSEAEEWLVEKEKRELIELCQDGIEVVAHEKYGR